MMKISGIDPLWILFLLIPYVNGFISIGLTIYLGIKLGKSFNKGAGFTVGLILIPAIFYMILGLGNSEYVGPGGNSKSSSEPIDVTPNE